MVIACWQFSCTHRRAIAPFPVLALSSDNLDKSFRRSNRPTPPVQRQLILHRCENTTVYDTRVYRFRTSMPAMQCFVLKFSSHFAYPRPNQATTLSTDARHRSDVRRKYHARTTDHRLITSTSRRSLIVWAHVPYRADITNMPATPPAFSPNLPIELGVVPGYLYVRGIRILRLPCEADSIKKADEAKLD
jgi:hypothetical protein